MLQSDLTNTLGIRSTRFFMKFAGFWIWNDRRGKVIMDFAMCYSIGAIALAMLITGSDLWFSRNNFYQAAYAACNAMTVVIILLKLTVFSIRREPFMNLIKFCHENFWKWNDDTFSDDILRECNKRCIYCVGVLIFFGECTVVTYALHPIIENIGKNETDRILPFNIWLNFPVTTTPYYEITFFIETMSMIHSGICYFCFDNLLYVMNIHVTGQFRILQKKFEDMCYVSKLDNSPDPRCNVELNDNYNDASTRTIADPRDQYSEFKDCVRRHQTLIRFTKMVEDVYTFVMLGQVIIFSLLICLISYQAVLADGTMSRRIIFIVHCCGTYAQLFLFTSTCDNLTQQSEGVAQAAYRAEWYRDLSNPVSRRLGKDIKLVIMRCRRPCCLTAGGFFPVSLETFTTILSTAMSYLTLLRQGQEASS